MIEVKNPFGVRNGEMITINDLTIDERGKKCNCQCPSCGGNFLARMGEERVHHFAHDGDACDEVKAYLCGLYRVLLEYLEKECLYLPELRIQIPLTPNCEINESTIKFLASWQYNEKDISHMQLSGGKEVYFDFVEIDYDDKGCPSAIIAHKGNRKLALVIKPPDTVCKGFCARKYNEYSTIEVVFDDDKVLSNSKIQSLFDMIKNRQIQLRWLYSGVWGEQPYKDKIESKKKEIDSSQDKLLQPKHEISEARESSVSTRKAKQKSQRISSVESIADEIRRTKKPRKRQNNTYYLCIMCDKDCLSSYVWQYSDGEECGFCICKSCSPKSN